MEYLKVAAGLVALIVAGDFMVRGSVSLSQRLGVSILFISLTVVAFGTSAPELVVGIDGVLSGHPDLVMGNVVGSNIANVLLVVGIPAMIAPIVCNGAGMIHNILAMTLASVFFVALCFFGPIGFWTGLLLLTLLAGYLYGNVQRAKRDPKAAEAALQELEELPRKPYGLGVTLGLILIGLAGLIGGAHYLIEGSVTIARSLGVSEAVIGLTLVALGTSLPELVTGIVAACRNHCDVALGNVVGSNIFNLLGIIGVSAMVGNIPVPHDFLRVDLWIMLACCLLLLPFGIWGRHIGKAWGLTLLASYVGYILYLAQSATPVSLDNPMI